MLSKMSKGVIKMMSPLKRLRLEKGWSQEELAERAEVSRMTVVSLEQEPRRVVNSKTLYKLAKALNVKIEDIFLAPDD